MAPRIQLLESAPAHTSSAVTIEQKLHLYRQNHAMIQQRVATETQALSVLNQFVAADAQLKTLTDRVLTGATLDPVGLSQPDYASRVSTLEQALARLAQQPHGNVHPAYAQLAATLQDYKTALNLWQIHIADQQADPIWAPTADTMFQLISLSPADSQMLAQRYNLKPSPGRTSVSLRFTLWEIWRQAGDRIRKAQQQALVEPIAETASPPP